MIAKRSVLAGSRASAVLRAEDIGRARAFYEGTLGLPVEELHPGATELLVHAGEHTMLCLYERPTMPVPQNTVACFEVAGIAAAAAELRARGVVFEEYDIPSVGLKTVNGIARVGDDRRAWFKDSEGNILVIREVPSTTVPTALGREM
jgi:predicted enzyme related to lactoylglutathione lyase